MPNNSLSEIKHVVVLMLENRSFDHMLGFLYTDQGNVSPLGQPFEGLTGKETNLDKSGKPVQVFKITTAMDNAYFMPGADPGEGYNATNSQLFGNIHAPTSAPDPSQSNQGFVTDFDYTLGWQSSEGGWTIKPGTTSSAIMGMFTPEMLPVLSGLAKGFAVCDHWYGSAPTETLPNRAFACAATSQGHMDDKTKTFTCPSIFGSLETAGVSWSIYGYTETALARHNFPDTTSAPEARFGVFTDFQAACKQGTLASFVFLEPSWGEDGNSQHPVGDVSLGEQLIHDVYYALRSNPDVWAKTLLVITYDEHGGCYDHVAPPWNATPPDSSVGEYGFDFRRFGVRVPAVLVSPLIEAGTVFRVPDGVTPLDHTSILKTVENLFGIKALTARDAAASDLSGVLTRTTLRDDDPLQGVTVPSSGAAPAATAVAPSHLQQVHAELVSGLTIPDSQGGARHVAPALKTSADANNYVNERTNAWVRSRPPQHAD